MVSLYETLVGYIIHVKNINIRVWSNTNLRKAVSLRCGFRGHSCPLRKVVYSKNPDSDLALMLSESFGERVVV